VHYIRRNVFCNFGFSVNGKERFCIRYFRGQKPEDAGPVVCPQDDDQRVEKAE
jgi:hypothetical protein